MNDIEILENYLKYIKQFDNNSDFIPALENLIQRNKDLEQIEKEHKKENGRLREKVKKIEEYVKQCDWHNNDVYIGEDILDLLEESEE